MPKELKADKVRPPKAGKAKLATTGLTPGMKDKDAIAVMIPLVIELAKAVKLLIEQADDLIEDADLSNVEADKLAAMREGVAKIAVSLADKPVAMQAVVRPDTIPLDLGGDAAKTKVSIPKGQHD